MATTKTNAIQDAEILELEPAENGLSIPQLPSGLFLIDEHEVKKAELIEIKNEALKMTVKGVDDREGYEAVRVKNGELRTLRTTLEKIRKEKTKPINDFLKDYKAQVDEFGSICLEGEAHLKAQMDVVDKEKERLAEIAEQERKAKIQARVQALMNFGARYLDDAYSFDYAPQHNTSTLQINAFTDEEYALYIQELAEDCAAHQKALAKAEQERLAEAARVAKEAEDLKQERMRQEEERNVLMFKQVKLRIKELQLNGIDTFPSQEFMEEADDEVWENYVNKHLPVVGEASMDIAPAEVEASPETAALMAEVEQDVEEAAFAHFKGSVEVLFYADRLFIESPLGKSTLRLFMANLEAEAMLGLDLTRVTHSGAFEETGLLYVVYK